MSEERQAGASEYGLLHVFVVIVGFTAILGKLITLEAAALVTWRTLLAASMIALVYLAKPTLKQKPDRRTVLKLVATGGILGLHWLSFFGSIKVSNVTICLTGMATTSLFTAWVEPLITKRPFRREELVIAVVILGGLGLVLQFALDHWFGLVLALVSAFLAAVFPSLNRLYVRGGLKPLTITYYEMIGATLCCGVWALVAGQDLSPAGSDWLWLLILAGVCTVLAFWLHVWLLRRLSVYATALALNFEPVYGILLAAVIFAEHEGFSPQFFLGTLVLIAANVAHSWMGKRKAKRIAG